MSDASLALAKQLINIKSITPDDNGCQDVIIDRLKAQGFIATDLTSNGVRNTWLRRGEHGPLFTFSGHTDTVPPGSMKRWKSDPFNATERDGYLFGRGAADMKSALAAMVIAIEEFIANHPDHNGSIALMLTSDEEGDATDGTQKIVEYCQAQHIKPDWCLIGEASSNEVLGDSIKVGRRGSLHGELQVIGKQGHIAYPQLADNPIHRCFKALDALTHTEWDQGNDFFTPTSFQIYNINADTGATNIIPGALTARFNFRYSPASSAEALQARTHKVFDDHGLHYKIHWNLMSQPFLSECGALTQACQRAIETHCNLTTNPNTTGGTSDGRFIHALGCEIVELGPVNKSIHHVNEHVSITDLAKLTKLYYTTLESLLL